MTTSTSTKRAALYARVSSAEQARPDATSIDQQLDRGANYAAAMTWDVVERISDDGITGSTSLSERPQGRKLLYLDTDVIIFWSMDRFTRSAARGLADIEVLEAKGISLVFVKEAVDTSTPSGRLFRTMLAAFAEFERETIRDRNMSGRFGGAEKGRWVSGQLPFGYGRDDNGDIAIREDEAEVVRKIFALRIEGLSMPAIAEHLNKKTDMRPRKRFNRRTGRIIPARFSPGSIKTYLSNEAYAGVPIERSIAPSKGAEAQTFYWETPAIVAMEDWHAAQASFLGRRPAGDKRALYALSMRVSHKHPDAETPVSMFGVRLRRGRLYRCEASRRSGMGCPGLGQTTNHRRATSIDAGWVEGSVLLWVIENLGTPSQVVAFLDATERRLTPAISIREANEELARIKARRERWLGLYTDGLIERGELDLQLQAITVEEAAVQRVLVSHTAASLSRNTIAKTLGELLTMTITTEDGADPAADEDPPRGSAEWRHRLRVEAIEAATRQGNLSAWAVEEAAHLITTLDITAVLSESDDYRRPVVTLEVGYEDVNRFLGGCSPRFRLTSPKP